MPHTTERHILRDARRMVRGEKLADFINDPKQFIHRMRVGYYHDRFLLASRWLINDEQQHIYDYYNRQ